MMDCLMMIISSLQIMLDLQKVSLMINPLTEMINPPKVLEILKRQRNSGRQTRMTSLNLLRKILMIIPTWCKNDTREENHLKEFLKMTKGMEYRARNRNIQQQEHEKPVKFVAGSFIRTVLESMSEKNI